MKKTKKDLENAPAIRQVYRADVQGKVIIGDVKHETEKQLKVIERGIWGWLRTSAKDAPPMVRWYDTPRAALEARAEEIRERIDRSKEQLQRERTWLGMVEGELSRLPESPRIVDAVDPHADVLESGPRA